MKFLLVAESRDGKLCDVSHELLAFAAEAGAEYAYFQVGSEESLPCCDATLYLADRERYGEYSPDLHKELILAAVEWEQPDAVVFMHSSYGWDLAPRVAVALQAAQVSEVVAINDGEYEVGCCNGKMRRSVKPTTPRVVLTLQSGAFNQKEVSGGTPRIVPLEIEKAGGQIDFIGYEEAEKKSVDLTRADIVVSAGRGVGKKENVPLIADLARALGGELGGSRPVVDAGWLDHSHQVGTTGQVVSPKLYMACGISGAIQHVAGMKRSEFVVAINKDRDAPIGEIADVLVVADVMQFVPALIARIGQQA